MFAGYTIAHSCKETNVNDICFPKSTKKCDCIHDFISSLKLFKDDSFFSSEEVQFDIIGPKKDKFSLPLSSMCF